MQVGLLRDRRDTKIGKRTLYPPGARRPAGIDEQRGRVEQLIGRARRLGRRCRRAYGRRDFGQPRLAREAPRIDAGDERIAVGVASNAAVEPLEPTGGVEQQRRRVTGASLHRRHPTPQRVDARAVELVRWARAPQPRPAAGHPPQTRQGTSPRRRRAHALAAWPPPGRAPPPARGMPRLPPLLHAPALARQTARGRRRCASSGPDAPCAACHARRSGSKSGSVAVASARWTRRRSSGAAIRYTAERTSG